MARTKQPRKANIPMMVETHRRLALELRMSVETLIGAPSIAAYNQVSKMLAAMNSAGMPQTVLDGATKQMNGICDRVERVGKVGVNAIEAQALRLALGPIDRALPHIPVNKLQTAIAQANIYCDSIGA